MKKWTILMLMVATLVFGSVIGFNLFKGHMIKQYLANRPEPVYPVTVVKVAASDWQPAISVIGFIEPHQGVMLTAQSAGVIKDISFKSGSGVKKGDLLVTQDVSVESANLKRARVSFPAVEAKYQRYLRLYENGALSKDKLDDVQASYLSAMAEIESLKATIHRRQIRAPFDGIIGIRNVYLGQYLQPGTQISLLESTKVMRLRFSVSQNEISRIHLKQALNIHIDAYPEKSFVGSISAIEPAINHQSGMMQVQADIPNHDNLLRSGMFARAEILLPKQTDQVILPQRAITYTLYGDNIYRITKTDEKDDQGNPALRVHQQVVKVGERKDANAHVLSGIAAGDLIVTSGQVRLSNDVKVKIVEDKTIEDSPELPML